ncbi:MAG: hypothetical protein RLZZ118_1167 [Bacteroidota bacterium]|jgi:hypothetical protein
MIRELTWSNIVEMLHSAKNEVFLIMPSIHEEWIETLKSNPNIENLQVFACIDNSEMVIRNGYGSINSIDSLIQLKAIVTECPGLRISFISVDDESFFLFLESRIIAGDPEGYNAVEVHPQEASEFIHKFFKAPYNEIQVLVSEPLHLETHSMVKEAIKINPPEEPDLKRKINTYRTHFQYAEIHFEGGGIQSKTITIPKDALPFKDAGLKDRMKTRFNLFSKEDTDKWNKIDEIDAMIKAIRKEFLTPCKYKRGRNIINKSKKEAFVSKAEEFKKIVEEKKKDLTDEIQKAINKSEDVLTIELTNFFEINPPDEMLEIKDTELRKRQIAKMIQEILFKTKIPSASNLINKMVIETEYAEFTEEDLSDEKFLAWFKEKNLLSKEVETEIASFENAFGLRK